MKKLTSTKYLTNENDIINRDGLFIYYYYIEIEKGCKKLEFSFCYNCPIFKIEVNNLN